MISLCGPSMKLNALRIVFLVGSDVRSGVLVENGCQSVLVRYTSCCSPCLSCTSDGRFAGLMVAPVCCVWLPPAAVFPVRSCGCACGEIAAARREMKLLAVKGVLGLWLVGMLVPITGVDGASLKGCSLIPEKSVTSKLSLK